ncbi:hypothetical protein BaRGS_00011002 [Batillaria attramentaria]|uniref:Uncharacterized protein n=1 Tax=Batillaria attramentaria TaxID=370345 RepID=A0ABD0LFG9_9CAEN
MLSRANESIHHIDVKALDGFKKCWRSLPREMFEFICSNSINGKKVEFLPTEYLDGRLCQTEKWFNYRREKLQAAGVVNISEPKPELLK